MRLTPTITRLVIAGCLVIPLADLSAARPQSSAPSSPPADSSQHDSFLKSYCVTCHNQRLRTAGLTLDTVDWSNVSGNAEVLEKVLRKLRMGAMPPPGRPRPDIATAEVFVSSLERELDKSPSLPGRPGSVHRLNRAEYQNAIRDMLDLRVDVAPLLPADDTDKNGFDNVANLLSFSPALLDRYLSAARRISRLAVGISPRSPFVETYRTHQLLDQTGRVSDELPFGSRGGFAIRHQFPVDGEYVIKIRLRRQLYDYVIGLGSPHQMEVRLDREPVLSTTVGGQNKGKPAPASFAGEIEGDAEWEEYALHADDGLEVRVRAKAGLRTVGVSFVDRHAELEDGLRPPLNGFAKVEVRDESLESDPAVETLTIAGPFMIEGPGDTPSRRRIFSCKPMRSADERPCAERILSSLARSAYRRPASKAEVETLLGFYDEGRREGSFDSGLQFGLERILSDPNFLVRIERDPVGAKPGTAYRISDVELGSRLSFFLWSSIPDEKLLAVAAQGSLSKPAVLTREVRRMLVDPRATALIQNFVGQWLQLRNIRSVTPNVEDFEDFDENLREDFKRETELFVESTLREDRSVVDLLRANYTFLNERLARHYQIPNVFGNRFRRVTFPDGHPRGGLLGQGSLLTLTSYPNRTSPVLRGKWLLDNIFGAPPPPPPPNVPSLPDRVEGTTAASVRERLEHHRKNPVCSTCHAPMDPLGFALENFDAIGAWRTTNEVGTPIDVLGALPDGTEIPGPLGLRTLLVSRREQFARTITEKLLSYAIGRDIEYYDLPTVRSIVREAASSDYRWSSIILGIVRSRPFQMRSSRLEDSKTASASAGKPRF